MTKTINVPKVSMSGRDAADVAAVLDANHVAFTPIDTVNWAEFPYKPAVEFRAAHTGDALLLNYRVTEEAVRAEAGADNGPVWEDSCVEFFVSFDGRNYHNVECNCVGTILSAVGPDRNERQLLSQQQLDGVSRYSTLKAGQLPKGGPVSWSVSLVVPASLFAASGVKDLSGVKARCNFYKCGDKLPTPHFLSWNPIGVPNPDFHRPEFFGEINFE